jgi:hypothetical protein
MPNGHVLQSTIIIVRMMSLHGAFIRRDDLDNWLTVDNAHVRLRHF